MHIQILGTGGYHPNERRHTACVLLPELGLAFDAGTSFFRLPERLRRDTLHVFVSHPHLDHVVGLTYALAPILQGRITQVIVYGSPRTLETIRRHLFDPSLFPVEPPFQYVDLAAVPAVEFGPCRVTHHPLSSHPGGSTAYRLDLHLPAESPRSLAYVTDTVVDGTYTEFIRGADLLIHECSFPDSLSEWCQRTGHSHTTQVARLAADAQVGQLVLFHVDPLLTGDDPLDLAAALDIFPNTLLAEDLCDLVL